MAGKRFAGGERKVKVPITSELLKKIINFVEPLVAAKGQVQSSVGPRTIMVLLNFKGFSFVTDLNSKKDGVGGNTIEIWFHPNSEYENSLTPRLSVLEIWWLKDLDRSKVLKIVHKEQWLNKLLAIIDDQKAKHQGSLSEHSIRERMFPQAVT